MCHAGPKGEIKVSIEIKVLGPGCARCKQLYSEAERAIAQLAAPATLIKVEDIKEIMAYKILATPALVINGEVKSAGRIPNAGEIASWLATTAIKQ
ncbi:MAG: thioredoxin family protein [Acidobacteriia bacterium]|nr:thioredoxin family protein [Terriglobia bacterium]